MLILLTVDSSVPTALVPALVTWPLSRAVAETETMGAENQAATSRSRRQQAQQQRGCSKSLGSVAIRCSSNGPTVPATYLTLAAEEEI